jgi:hypothetical protein
MNVPDHARRPHLGAILASGVAVALAAATAPEAGVHSVSPSSRPMAAGSLSQPARRTLTGGYLAALRRIGDAPGCRALFDQLKADPVEALATTSYFPASGRLEATLCSSGALAVTAVGRSKTWLCSSFAGLDVNWAALALLHEALHRAGLPESPSDPHAMTSDQITRLVTLRCRP